ncbi:hypothetical protein BGZ80_001683 [Entomortierella chlamydospora]|uniref:RING-type domain-containing protein n=1 Tax=Entomortierella chlamydospora TaxID=101097 RepID=A0A9P6N319_9FUNG|nr:hypothetical protein BGZ79_009353 [Entomortierella chlamydospora]KAG0021804.1 hypothetical protein BGZ80_001683 [Entomortierella chlamydospora]
MSNSNADTSRTALNGGNASSGNGRSTVARPERPPSRSGISPTGSPGLISRSSTRSPGLQAPNPTSNGRTPRGLTRVQRMYDEQSIRSTRSSSRASSVIAASPSLNSPSNEASLQGHVVEYMDIDSDTNDIVPHEQQRLSAAQHHNRSHAHNTQTGSAFTEHYHHHQLTSVPSDNAMNFRADQSFARPSITTRSRIRASQEPVSSASSAITGSDNNSFYAGLSNSRGGTSISSSLLPIRPDSDDDDDMENDLNSNATHGGAQTRSRSRRYPDPDVVADLIHHQFVQSLREVNDNVVSSAPAATTTVTTTTTTTTTTVEPFENNSDINNTNNSASVDNAQGRETVAPTSHPNGSVAVDSHTGITSDDTPTTPHRMRLRSSSMRGLLGFQPTEESATDERPVTQDSSSNNTVGADTETQPEGDSRPTNPTDAMDRSQFLLSQLPLFMRLLVDFNRGLRAPVEPVTDDEDRANEVGESASNMEDGSPGLDTANTSGTDNASNQTLDSDTPNPDPAARSRRRHTTIRFIQIGGGLGPSHRARSSSTTAEHENEGDEGDDNQAGQAGEEFGEAVIMLLTGPSSDSDLDTDDSSTPEGSDDAETPRARTRHRSPWVVMTLSGAYLNSLMAAGSGGEGGSNYDDLWMLSNLIGPARPITTTQEAIDNAGFAVGRFEQEAQGMRNISTLGDGTKCLVCMSDYEEGESMRALKCKHGFHLECIDKWLTTGANKCPVCRAAAVSNEPPVLEPQVQVNSGAGDQ